MSKQELHHVIDMWGYYCESWCDACKVERYICSKCSTNYGKGQWHSEQMCQQILQEEKAKQLEFPFMKQHVSTRKSSL